MGVEIRTIKKVRSLFTNVIKPRAFVDPRTGKTVGDEKYDVLLLLDKEDFDALYEGALAAVNETWPGRDPSEIAFPFKRTEKVAEKRRAKLAKDGKSEQEIDRDVAIYPPGHFTLKASSKFPIVLCYSNGQRVVTIPDEEKQQFAGKFYNGCEVSVVLDFVTYPAKNDDAKDGVTAYLKQVFWAGPGQRIGGQPKTDHFNEYIGEATFDDPTGGDGLPF